MERERCIYILKQYKKNGLIIELPSGVLNAITYNYREKIPNCVNLLSKWRMENPSLSPTRFPISDKRTESWLINNILNNEQRVLFMIQNNDGNNIGHIGLSTFDLENDCIRVDSVLRGIKDQCPGIMYEAIEALKKICSDIFNATKMDLVVLSDNYRAINLYHRCGFLDTNLIPLRKNVIGNEITWEEDSSLENAEQYFLSMQCVL